MNTGVFTHMMNPSSWAFFAPMEVTIVFDKGLLLLSGIFIAALYLLFKRVEKTAKTANAALAASAKPTPRTDSETDILRIAFGVIQRRVTEEVTALYPKARWQWLSPNAQTRIEKGEPVAIILSGAGGYRKAAVRIHNLTFQGLLFETGDEITQHKAPDICEDEMIETKIGNQEEPINYAYLAFEWTEAHLMDLNSRANEAIGRGQSVLLIPGDELPNKDSWPDICKQLVASGFANAVPDSGGIQISLQQ